MMNLLRLRLQLRHRFPTLLRRFSSEHDDSVVTQALQLLQPPHDEWKLEQLSPLLFSHPPPSPRAFLHITRRLSSPDKALHFFHVISPSADLQSIAFSYQALYELAIRNPDSGDKLLELYQHSKERDVPLTLNAATLLIRWFGYAGMSDESLSVFNDLDPSLRNTHICNALIDALFRCGRVDDALKVLDKMLEWDSQFPLNEATGDIVFPAISKMEGSGRIVNEEDTVVLVLKFFEHGVLPDTRSLCELITKLRKGRKTNWAWDVMHDAVKLGCQVDTACCNSLLIGLERVRDYNRVSTLLEEMKEMGVQPNVRTFSILINMLCISRMVDSALELFERIRRGEDGVSVKPDVVVYKSLIHGLCNAGRPGEGFDMMEQMRMQDGCAPNHAIYNSLVGGFCKQGEVERARQLLDRMESEGLQPGVGTLNAAVTGMCKHGIPDSALEFINEMQQKGLKGDASTYATLIEAYSKVDSIDKCSELFDQMMNEGHAPNVSVYYTLISCLSKAVRTGDAIKIASKLKEAGYRLDIVCFNTLISGLCKEKNVSGALELLKEMEEADVKPDYITYNTLVSYFSKFRSMSAAQRVVMSKIKAGL